MVAAIIAILNYPFSYSKENESKGWKKTAFGKKTFNFNEIVFGAFSFNKHFSLIHSLFHSFYLYFTSNDAPPVRKSLPLLSLPFQTAVSSDCGIQPAEHAAPSGTRSLPV